MHATFFFAGNFSIAAEMNLLAIYLTWTLFWDFLWFIMNPYYGWKAFSPKAVWWFGEEPWLFNKLPVKYFVQIGIAFAFSTIAVLLTNDSNYLFGQIVMTITFVLLTVLAHFLFRPIFHRYYWKFHKKVDWSWLHNQVLCIAQFNQFFISIPYNVRNFLINLKTHFRI